MHSRHSILALRCLSKEDDLLAEVIAHDSKIKKFSNVELSLNWSNGSHVPEPFRLKVSNSGRQNKTDQKKSRKKASALTRTQLMKSERTIRASKKTEELRRWSKTFAPATSNRRRRNEEGEEPNNEWLPRKVINFSVLTFLYRCDLYIYLIAAVGLHGVVKNESKLPILLPISYGLGGKVERVSEALCWTNIGVSVSCLETYVVNWVSIIAFRTFNSLLLIVTWNTYRTPITIITIGL